MNIQDLIYFKHLAESLSFTDTAEHFYMSQPSISTAVKRLESELETTLVDRRKNLKQIKITAAGKILYTNATEVLEILDSTKQQIHDLEEENVYYGFLPTIGGFFLPQIMPKLQNFTQKITFIEEESSDIMLRHVQQGEVPIAIIGHENPHIPGKNIRQLPIKEFEMALWVSPDHPLAGKTFRDIRDAKDVVFLSLSEGYTHHRAFEKWVQKMNLIDPNVVYAKEIRTVHSIASSTQMAAFMSEIIVDKPTDLVKVPLHQAPKFYVSLIYNAEMENTMVQQEFNEAVIEVVEKEYASQFEEDML